VEVHVEQILLQIVNFGILFFVLIKFLFKPILKILDERSERIKEGLEAAEKTLAEQAKLEEKRQEQLTKAQQEAAKILADAKKEAERQGKAMVDEARKETAAMIEREEELFKTKLAKEELRLKGKIAKLVSLTTTTVLKEALTSQHQEEIIRRQMVQLKKLRVK